MNGEVGVESIPGKGSLFWFSAKLTKSSQQNIKNIIPNKNVQYDENKIKKYFSGLRILLAEDNEINRLVFEDMMKKVEIKLDKAENGLIAVEKASQETYDLILMDIQMPDMDGIEASRIIRENSPNRNTPILALTADIFEETRQQAKSVGMNGFITKPILPNELFANIATVLKIELPIAKEESKTNENASQATNKPQQQTENTSDTAAVDPKILNKLYGEDPAKHKMVLNKFIKQADTIIEQISQAVDASDPEQVSFHAHKLKSSSRFVGANLLADLCYELEIAGKKSDHDSIKEKYPQLSTTSQEVKNYIANLDQ